LNICCQDFSQIFENHVHLCFSNMFNMFEHWFSNVSSRLLFILSLTFYVFRMCSQVCVSIALKSTETPINKTWFRIAKSRQNHDTRTNG
jgi:hypothetical protein